MSSSALGLKVRKGRLTPLVCGYNLAAEDTIFKGGSPDKLRPIVCLAWLADFNQKRVLIDTGIKSIEICNRTLRGKYKWKQDQNLIDQLAEQGCKPGDIDQVIITHLHYDHSSNLPFFENAEIILSSRELDEFSCLSEAQQEAQAEAVGFIKNHTRKKIITGVYEDEYLKIEVIGGHTRGSLWVELDSQIGPTLLVGDSLFLLANLKEACPIGFTAEEAISDWVVDYLRGCSKIVLPSHDPDVLDFFL